MKHKRLLGLALSGLMLFSIPLYVPAGKIMPDLKIGASAADFVMRTTAPSTSDSRYYSSNPFYKNDYGLPNCTCYAYGRAWEILGTQPKLPTGNAGAWWWKNKSSGTYSYGSTPKLGAIACWDKYDQNKGHVAVVEKIEGDNVTLSESHWGTNHNGTLFDNKTMKADGSNYLISYRFLGYIYIGEFSKISHDPDGNLESAVGGTESITVGGWAQDKDDTSKHIRVDFYMDGKAGEGGIGIGSTMAENDRGDGTSTGFQATFSNIPSGEHHIYAYAINLEGTDGNHTIIGEQTVSVNRLAHDPTGNLEVAEGGNGTISASGWAWDEDDTNQTVEVHFYLGGKVGEGGTCVCITKTGIDRGDGTYTGFSATFNTNFPAGTYPLYAYAINLDGTGGRANTIIGQKDVTITENKLDLGDNFSAYIIHKSSDKKVTLNTANERIMVNSGDTGNNKTQIWLFTKNSDGTYQIKSAYNGKSLDVEGGGDGNAVPIRTWEANDTDAQKWNIIEQDGSYYLRPACSASRVMDLAGGVTDDGTVFQLYEKNTTNAQLFTLVKNVDTQAPQGKDVFITDLTPTGYTVHCKVNDDISVRDVKFPTWTEKSDATGNTQDDVTWESGILSGDEYIYHVNISDHNNEKGTYITHIYANDYDNSVCIGGIGVELQDDTTKPKISNVIISDVSSEGYTVSVTATDNVGISRVMFPTWSENADSSGNTQDDIIWGFGTKSGATYTYRVNINDHNNENGFYNTHIYAYDYANNETIYCVGVTPQNDSEKPKISDVVISDVSSAGYTVTVTATDNTEISRVMFPTWSEKADSTGNTQDDVIWGFGTKNGTTYTYRVNTNEHNNESGFYNTHIYAYDYANNEAIYCIGVTPQDSYIVTFDTNEAGMDFSAINVIYGKIYGELPTPKKDGYIFKGWYNEYAESQITSDTIMDIAQNHTLYAAWEKINFGDLNSDGQITIIDAVSLQKYLHSKQKITQEQYALADVNGDGMVNVYDLILLKRKLIYG